MRTSILRSHLAVAACLAYACTPITSDSEVATPDELNAITAWLESDDEDMAAVLRVGNRALPFLDVGLDSGPSSTGERSYKDFLGRRYDGLVAYSENHPRSKPASPRAAFIERYWRTYRLSHQTNAARALGGIATPEARQVLEDALRLPGQNDRLVKEIRKAIDKIDNPDKRP